MMFLARAKALYSAVFVVILTAPLTGTCLADDPSLSDTDAWLQDHLPLAAWNGSLLGTSWYVTASYTVSGCNLKINRTIKDMHVSAGDAVVYRLSFLPATGHEFQDNESAYVDGVSHSLDVIRFSDISPSGVQLQRGTEDDDDNIPPIQVAGRLLRFTFDDEAMAQRVKRAMLRAISLCGGKPEPF